MKLFLAIDATNWICCLWHAQGGRGVLDMVSRRIDALAESFKPSHVVACFDPGDARSASAGVSIYKNAVLRHGPLDSRGARYSSYAIHPRHGSAPLRLGTRDRDSFLAGALADVAIYPRVLGAREIRDNYAGA